MARTENRLDLDANLVGYWGFDEALESDDAIDESQYADAHLTVTGSVSVRPGRIGAARTLNSSAYASIALARLRLATDATLIGSFKLATFNNAGSLLRAFISCSGPLISDNQLYGLYIDSSGRLVYKHSSASGEVVVRTAPNTVRTNQYYNVIVVRSAGGTQLQFVLDNFIIPVADVTVGGGASTLPVPVPTANASAIFNVGRSQKEADSAYWDGEVDEVSLHATARAYQPYLRSSYFRASLRTPTFQASSAGSILNVSSTELGSKTRWWCYERDRDVFVVRESPFGTFGVETRLTAPGGSSSSYTSRPELIYDPATDTLLVAFVAGNRIFKVTASGTDDPATINMPFTTDLPTIIKSLENAEGYRAGEGLGGQQELRPTELAITNRVPIKLNLIEPNWNAGEGLGGDAFPTTVRAGPHVPQAVLITEPTLGFGIMIAAPDSTQAAYRVYHIVGGAAVALGAPVKLVSNYGVYFAAIPTRDYRGRYVVEALDAAGNPTRAFSVVLEDSINFAATPGGALILIDNGGDSVSFGEGLGGQRELNPSDLTVVNKTPIKLNIAGANWAAGEGLGGQQASFTQNSKTVMT